MTFSKRSVSSGDRPIICGRVRLMLILKTLTLAGGYIYYTAGVCTEVLRPEE